MAARAVHIALALIDANVLPATIRTSKVVKLLAHKKWHRHRVTSVENRKLLGGRRVGAGVHLEFDTIKVIELKTALENER